jgi:hypothetical protein
MTLGCNNSRSPLEQRSVAVQAGQAMGKKECEALIDALLPFAKQMLVRYREFLPFGGTMSPSGEIVHAGAWTGDERPPSQEVISVLETGFRKGVLEGKYKATAIVIDMRVVPPGKATKQDAVAIRLDHKDGYSAQVFFPYSFTPSGELVVEMPFAVRGEGRMFGNEHATIEQ